MAMGGVAFALLSRERKLAREGKVAEGVVTDCVQEKNQFRVEYEFHTEDGVLIKGNDDFENAYGAGARIWILYLPQKPKEIIATHYPIMRSLNEGGGWPGCRGRQVISCGSLKFHPEGLAGGTGAVSTTTETGGWPGCRGEK